MFAFSEKRIMFALEIKNGDYLGYSFFQIFKLHISSKKPPIFGPGSGPTSKTY